MSNVRLTPEQYRRLTGGGKPISAGAKRKRTTKAAHLARMLAVPPRPEMSEVERQAQRGLFEKHDTVVREFRLPLPPSVNEYWHVRPISKTRCMVYISAEGQAYREAVQHMLRGDFREPLTGRLRVLLSFSFRTNGRNDGSNRIKALEDAMTHAGVWMDDSQIDDERWIRGPVDLTRAGYVDVIVETIVETIGSEG